MELIGVANLGEMPPRLTEYHLQILGEALIKDLLDLLTDRLVAAEAHHLLEGRVTARDPAVLINREQADIDRLDDRLVEFLQQGEFFGMLLLLAIEPTVFNSDTDVARDCLEDLKVLRGK